MIADGDGTDICLARYIKRTQTLQKSFCLCDKQRASEVFVSCALRLVSLSGAVLFDAIMQEFLFVYMRFLFILSFCYSPILNLSYAMKETLI